MSKEMQWSDIVIRDAYLAGSIAARGHEWWMEETAECEADSVQLTGEHRSDFLRGWQDEIAEQEKERESKAVMLREYDEMARGYERGDPAR